MLISYVQVPLKVPFVEAVMLRHYCTALRRNDTHSNEKVFKIYEQNLTQMIYGYTERERERGNLLGMISVRPRTRHKSGIFLRQTSVSKRRRTSFA